jgi:hypothetical protein
MATRTNKLLLGCALGCGGIILTAVIAVVLFVSWLHRPGTLIEPERLLGSDTTGYVECSLTLEDPATAKAVETFLEHPQLRNEIKTPLPPELQKFLISWQGNRDREKFRRLFPLVAAWTLRPDEEPDRDLHLASLSIQNFGNNLVLADFILGLTARTAEDTEGFRKFLYQDEAIYQFPKGVRAAFFIRGSDLFVTQDIDTARQAVDRLLAEQATPRETTALDTLFARTSATSMLRGGLTNARGEIFRLWRLAAVDLTAAAEIEVLARDLRGATLEGGFVEGGDFAGRIRLQAPSPEWAAAHAGPAAQAFLTGLGYESLTLSATGEAEAEWIRIDFRVKDVPGALDRLIAGLADLPGRASRSRGAGASDAHSKAPS